MKARKTTGSYLALAGGILAAAAIVLYRNVMYIYQPVYYFLAGAVAAAVICFLIGGALPRLAGLCTVAGAALMASAAVWGTSLMVNQIGYVYARLDGVDTIRSFIIFTCVSAVGMILFIAASFLPVAAQRDNA